MVVAFHLEPRILPGGFVGVDVFFVISGYLITSIIAIQTEQRRFNLRDFYQRRIARIFPVYFLVSLFILAVATQVYSDQDLASAGANAAGAALCVANLKLMLLGSYFDVSRHAQPFLHYWSLSLEEQFYVAWPIMIYLWYRIGGKRSGLLKASCVIFVASFVSCLVLTMVKPTYAFYLLPTRAWELIAGGAVAIYSLKTRESGAGYWPTMLFPIGLLLVVVSGIVLRESESFPGYWALLPVMGAALLVGPYRDASTSRAYKMLANRPTIAVGQFSYSLYLWHWPIFCFIDYQYFLASDALRTSLKIILAVVFTILSYRIVENPARQVLNRPRTRYLGYAAFVIGAIGISVVGSVIRNTYYLDASASSIREGGIVINANFDRPGIVLIGDSHAAMYGRSVEHVADRLKLPANLAAVPGSNPLPPSQLFDDCVALVARERPAVTVLVLDWRGKLRKDSNQIKLVIDILLRHSDAVVLIEQPPSLPAGISRETVRRRGLQPIVEEAEQYAERRRTNDYLQTLVNERVQVVPVDDLFLDRDGFMAFTNRDGCPVFQDEKHLSSFGARLLEDRLQTTIASLLKERKGSRDR